MQLIDHSLTYKSRSLKDWVHRKRLRDICATVQAIVPAGVQSYADVGCSNGYVTETVASRIGALRVVGFDHSEKLLDVGRAARPQIEFRRIDLNVANGAAETFDLVTCFETLEHVGNLEAAIGNIARLVAPGGSALVSVPIEVGPIGIAKYLAKSYLYGYSLGELGARRGPYLRSLLKGDRMSSFRPLGRPGFGTHFGFDYRDIDDAVAAWPDHHVKTWTAGASRFFTWGQPAHAAAGVPSGADSAS